MSRNHFSSIRALKQLTVPHNATTDPFSLIGLKSIFIFFLVTTVLKSPAETLHLSAGQTFESEFQNLPYSGFMFPNQSNEGSVFLDLSTVDGLDAGESIRLQIFENNFTEPPV